MRIAPRRPQHSAWNAVLLLSQTVASMKVVFRIVLHSHAAMSFAGLMRIVVRYAGTHLVSSMLDSSVKMHFSVVVPPLAIAVSPTELRSAVIAPAAKRFAP